MTKISLLLLFVSFSIPLLIYSQDIDPSFCDINNLPAGPDKLDPPVYDLKMQYQARIEKNSKNLGETQEITEYYDGVNNIGVSINRYFRNKVQTYSYYDTDELFVVEDYKCTRYKISEAISYGISEFLLIPDGDGKEKIASLLTLILSSKSVNLVYTGSGNFIRGIPVDEWQTCIFSNFDKKSLKVTISFTRTIWKPAYPLNDNTSIPVQLLIESKDSNDVEDTIVYTFTRFRPFLDQDMEEKEHLIPRGVYCQDKINTKDLPTLPNAFRYESQIIEPSAFQHHNGSENVDARSIREEYNYNSKLYRFDFYSDNNINSEILDFNTGVKYIYNSNGKCKLEMIDINKDFFVTELGNDGLIKMKNSSEFFHFNGGNFQYSGSRIQEGVNTDLWIGRRDIFNTTSNVEWYFMSQKWNNSDQSYITPILLRLLQEVKTDNGSVLIKPISKYFFNFRTKNLMLRDFDLSVCEDQNKRKSYFIEMQLPLSTAKQIYNNKIQFSEAFVSFIEDIAKVTPLRIADISVDFDDDSTLVYFNIFEKVKNYGKIALPKNDVSLDDAINYLKDYFSKDNNLIELSFKNNLEGIVKIKAINSTFRESIGQVINAGYNDGSTAAATIMSLLIGLLVALVIVTLHKFKRINIPFLG